MSSTIKERVLKVVTEELGVKADDCKDEATLSGDLGADSLDVVDVVMAIEEEFGIEVPDDDAPILKTVGDIVGYVEGRVGA